MTRFIVIALCVTAIIITMLVCAAEFADAWYNGASF